MSALEKLIRTLSQNGMYSGKAHLFQFNIYCQFEAYGRATENWDTIYEVVLPKNDFRSESLKFTSTYLESYDLESFARRVLTKLNIPVPKDQDAF